MLPRRLTNGSQLPPSATAAPALLLQTVQALGFIINWDKSELTPTQCPNRATIDIPRQLARPSQRRIATLWRSARLLRGRRQAPAKTWLQFRGFSLETSRRPSGLPTAHAPAPAVFLRNYQPGRDPLSRRVPLPRRSASSSGGGAVRNSRARATH